MKVNRTEVDILYVSTFFCIRLVCRIKYSLSPDVVGVQLKMEYKECYLNILSKFTNGTVYFTQIYKGRYIQLTLGKSPVTRVLVFLRSAGFSPNNESAVLLFVFEKLSRF